jgi:uncharacterized protein (DUF302 family)
MDRSDSISLVHDLPDGRRADWDVDQSLPRFDAYLDGGALDGEILALPDEPELWVEVSERQPDGSWLVVASERYEQVPEPDDVHEAGWPAGANTLHRVFRLATTHDGSTRSSSPVSVVTKGSRWSVADTVARLSAAVVARGMKVFAVIDHSGEAKEVGLELRDTKVVIFGSPKAGTPVMVAAPLAALDLPLKVLVWRDADQTKLSYPAPRELAARYGLDDELAARLAGIDALTDAVLDG